MGPHICLLDFKLCHEMVLNFDNFGVMDFVILYLVQVLKLTFEPAQKGGTRNTYTWIHFIPTLITSKWHQISLLIN